MSKDKGAMGCPEGKFGLPPGLADSSCDRQIVYNQTFGGAVINLRHSKNRYGYRETMKFIKGKTDLVVTKAKAEISSIAKPDCACGSKAPPVYRTGAPPVYRGHRFFSHPVLS